jgi:glycosyltransferase involved in cell wall biosynthesis
MRIAVLTNTTSSSTGAGRIASVYNGLLMARGHEVRVFGPAEWFEQLHATSPLGRLARHLRDLRPNEQTVNEIVTWAPDVLLTHNLTGCGFGTPQKIRERGVRWVHILHDVQLFEPSGRMIVGESSPKFRDLWRRLWSDLRRSTFGLPDVVVSPTNWLLGAHRQFGFFQTAESRIISNPMQIDAVDVFSVDRDPRRLVFVGRLDTDKGADVLFDAWPKLRDVVSELVLIGDGTWRDRFEALHDPRIILRGVLPSAEVFQTLVSAGLCVVPSRVQENQPTVILEALAAGCRVIASDVGGVGETLGQAGWLIQPGSVSSLVNGIRSAGAELEDKARSTEREQILRAHDPDSAVDALLSVLMSNA